MSDDKRSGRTDSESRRAGSRRGRALIRLANLLTLAGLMTTAVFLITTGPGADGSAARAAAVPDWAAPMAAYYLGVASADQLQLSTWQSVDTATGRRVTSEVPGEGLVQFDPATHEVNEVIWSTRLGAPTGQLMDQLDAVRTAQSYAAAHYVRFEDMVMRPVEAINHGAFAEYRMVWQARSGDAWLPSQVAIGVNARTGELAYYFSERVKSEIDTTPLVTADQAIGAAQEAAGLGPAATASVPELTVVVERAQQTLQWVVAVRAPEQAAPHIVSAPIVWVDARTGAARIAAVAS